MSAIHDDRSAFETYWRKNKERTETKSLVFVVQNEPGLPNTKCVLRIKDQATHSKPLLLVSIFLFITYKSWTLLISVMQRQRKRKTRSNQPRRSVGRKSAELKTSIAPAKRIIQSSSRPILPSFVRKLRAWSEIVVLWKLRTRRFVRSCANRRRRRRRSSSNKQRPTMARLLRIRVYSRRQRSVSRKL